MARRHHRKKELFGSIPELSMTPLIDVAWTLLVVFIIASPVIHHNIKVNLPKGQVHEVKTTNKSTIISLDKNLKIYFNSTPVSKKQLLVALAQLQNKQETVFIQADADITYGTVIELISEIKKAGISHVAMPTKPTRA
jgi:biopolymer transport protein TolR